MIVEKIENGQAFIVKEVKIRVSKDRLVEQKNAFLNRIAEIDSLIAEIDKKANEQQTTTTPESNG